MSVEPGHDSAEGSHDGGVQVSAVLVGLST